MDFDAIQYLVIEREDFYYKQLSHTDWTVYHVRSGSFRCTLDGREDVIGEGEVYVIPPNVEFSRSTLSPIRVDFLRFLPHVPQELPFEIPRGKYTPQDAARLQGTLHLMRRLSQEAGGRPSPALSHLLTDLLFQLHIERSAIAPGTDTTDPTVLRILQFFEENYSKRITMRDLAARHGLSPSGLIFKFKKATGQQPMRHLIAIRIRRAKQLLIGTAHPISEIAAAVGFENCYYFSNAFKKQTGLSPSDYRKKNSI